MDQGMSYSPFEKALSQVSPDDLVVLRTVKEGWYVEYKRSLPNARAIAKSVSAFANTYGGWLFIGVEELSKEEPVAGAFPGVAQADVDAALQCVRQAIAGHLSAAPWIETAVFSGPVQEIGLEAGFSVICIRVPWSVNAPHVHSSGQIYRRVADGSEPRPETDRHLLDQLWRRGDELKESYKEWVERDPEFSKSEENTPYVRLLLVPDLWGEREIRLNNSLRQMRVLFARPPDETRVMPIFPFDTVHQTSTGFVARQARNNDPTGLTATWRLWYDVASEVLLPLPLYEGSPRQIQGNLTEYEHAEEFCNLLTASGCKSAKIVDLNFLFQVVCGAIEMYETLLAEAGWTEGYYFKARVLNAWRAIPFLDTEFFVKDCATGGIPLCLWSIVTAPDGTSPDTFKEVISDQEAPQDLFGKQFFRAVRTFIPIAQAFGVTMLLDDEDVADFGEISRAGNRATANQTARNERLRSLDR